MRDVALPDGPGSRLVRSFAACLASVTETTLADLPPLTGDEPLAHAVRAWRTWLAGRGFGMVPIADPRSFQWAGYWIAVVDAHDDDLLAEGGEGQVAAVAFGTPPGFVLSPQDPGLLGRATADLPIGDAFAVASLDPRLPQSREQPSLSGAVEEIAIASAAGAPMRIVPGARALPGRGLEGDPYAADAGTFSPHGAHRPGYELTLIAAEVVEELTTRDARLDFASTRRNILTRGIDVNALVGREFGIGDVRCRGLRLAEPCAHLERIAGPGLLRPLIHRGGLRADILTDGTITSGSVVTT